MYSAIILAAGLGRKAWPYGEFRQKCTLPVANTPIVRRLVENLIEVGCSQIIVVVGHHRQQVCGAVADFPQVEFVTQQPLDGTATGALQAAQKLTANRYLIVYGDIVTGAENFRNVMEAFDKSGAEAAAMVQPLDGEDSRNWLCAGVNGDSLTGIEGHPRSGSHRLCGIYAFRDSATNYLL